MAQTPFIVQTGSASPPMDDRAAQNSLIPSPNYAPCYCEENVCRLLSQLHDGCHVPWQDLAALFITSPPRLTPVWCQATSQHTSGLVLWDYHVVALHRRLDGECLVWDLDRWVDAPAPCYGWAPPLRPAGRGTAPAASPVLA